VKSSNLGESYHFSRSRKREDPSQMEAKPSRQEIKVFEEYVKFLAEEQQGK
jgi:hypothetical protein